MKATLKVTSRGAVPLPLKLRAALGIRAGDQLIVEAKPEGLLLRPVAKLRLEAYSGYRVAEFDKAEAKLAKVLAARLKTRPGR